MLHQTGQYNDLSPALFKRLEDRIESFGKTVRYRFDIERENPDKSYYNGKTLFPQTYTLDPTIFKIVDKEEKRDNKSKTKTIALIDTFDEKGIPSKFIKCRIPAGARGILRLELEKEEDRAMCMYIELHPKLKGGDFSDPEKHQVITRIDEQAAATHSTQERKVRLKAMSVAADMTPKELVDFADAMQWDSSQTTEVLRNLTEELAESDPIFFTDLVEGKNIEYQAAVKQAMNKGLITFDPAEYKFTWTGNKQIITVLSPAGEKSEVEKLAEWLMSGGDKTQEIYKKIKSLIGADKKAA